MKLQGSVSEGWLGSSSSSVRACGVPWGHCGSWRQPTKPSGAVEESVLYRTSSAKTNMQEFNLQVLVSKTDLFLSNIFRHSRHRKRVFTLSELWETGVILTFRHSQRNIMVCPNLSKGALTSLPAWRVFLCLVELAWLSLHWHVRSTGHLTRYPPSSAAAALQLHNYRGDIVRVGAGQGGKGGVYVWGVGIKGMLGFTTKPVTQKHQANTISHLREPDIVEVLVSHNGTN